MRHSSSSSLSTPDMVARERGEQNIESDKTQRRLGRERLPGEYDNLADKPASARREARYDGAGYTARKSSSLQEEMFEMASAPYRAVSWTNHCYQRNSPGSSSNHSVILARGMIRRTQFAVNRAVSDQIAVYLSSIRGCDMTVAPFDSGCGSRVRSVGSHQLNQQKKEKKSPTAAACQVISSAAVKQ
jgi:hypothetical protein